MFLNFYGCVKQLILIIFHTFVNVYLYGHIKNRGNPILRIPLNIVRKMQDSINSFFSLEFVFLFKHFSTFYVNTKGIIDKILYYLLNVIEFPYTFLFIIYIFSHTFSLADIIFKRSVSNYNITTAFICGLFHNGQCIKGKCDQFIICKFVTRDFFPFYVST